MTIQAETPTTAATASSGSTVYTAPGVAGSIVPLKSRYDNFVGGEWVAPRSGEYGEDLAPATGQPFTEYARSLAADIDLAVAAARAAFPAWAATSTTDRAAVLTAIADRLQDNLERIAVLESWEN